MDATKLNTMSFECAILAYRPHKKVTVVQALFLYQQVQCCTSTPNDKRTTIQSPGRGGLEFFLINIFRLNFRDINNLLKDIFKINIK